MKRILILTAVSVMALSAMALADEGHATTPGLLAHATWVFQAQSLSDLVERADLIVIAEHGLAKPGRIAGRGQGEVPFTLNGFIVHSVLKGEFEDDVLLVEQTGGRLPSGEVLRIDDGGPFEPGKHYLLFLADQGTGLYYQLNQQARYGIDRNRLVGIEPSDAVVAQLHGRRLDTVLRDIRGAMPRQR